ncbi:hypothetical protein [Halopseudomonas pelagia]|uniref:Uncharacterized protein n=1 Tax=Halopseudomonas pelagia TaxID=553151 RepID=A0AA91Z7E6_9GAMM|nr:hypothetical protein [Halopseudomonas pelagia]PCD00953.1 hypothetical protein CO192_02745 [Halopseudomonas pelagia]QFY56136.1 hypothetical protein EAO82_06995 [Halopseudomonas pelagia]
MIKSQDASRISEVLFYLDPMGTCCKENDCYDEYDSIAQSAFQKLSNGQPIGEAISETLMDWFEVESIEPQTLANIVLALQAEN